MSNDPVEPTDEGGPIEEVEEGATEAAADNGGNGSKEPPLPANADEDDPIGYKSPPKKHRFPPKVSGNPKGRPKGAKGMKSILRKEFTERVRITENGKTRTISKMELMVKRLSEKGAKGDFKSITKLIDLGMMVFGTEDEVSRVPALTRDEQAIIDQAKKRRRALAGSGNGNRNGRGKKPPTKPSPNSTKGEGR